MSDEQVCQYLKHILKTDRRKDNSYKEYILEKFSDLEFE
jgi:hypothetical protein